MSHGRCKIRHEEDCMREKLLEKAMIMPLG
jgi:hypothetical protein